MRRQSFTDDTVDYAAVGATQAHDLMQYPPEHSVPAEDSWRIGSGEERFAAAGELLLSWAPLRTGELSITDVRPAANAGYSGVGFDADGAPVAPSSLEAEQRFAADGTPFVSPGAGVRLHGKVDGHRADAELRVISVFEEPRRVGFILGTVGHSIVSGEELFAVEWRDNDEVWFVVRAFDRPTAPSYRLFTSRVRRRRKALFARYLRAISPLYSS
ncbi:MULTISPECIES: DUF1990 family protein [Microbacterium]|uniref:DUF1990 family protein n=1 Tax=Microbacterium algihabitans TaxID=3075992 RepID=A0ABU3RUN4_9MICO|nr:MULTISPECIES: DUF1990 family protein [Microbacterium]MCD2169963.1 DUF1990 domain-containing protein [Microbacterium sp. JC 701]MCM3501752.1 DUF1990 domain-containing protein [Microbacterium sp. P26]MDU0326604.1 DUF1990 family protein [Microbacterium sp. KSW2-21]